MCAFGFVPKQKKSVSSQNTAQLRLLKSRGNHKRRALACSFPESEKPSWEEHGLFSSHWGLPYVRSIYVLSVGLMHSQIEVAAADVLVPRALRQAITALYVSSVLFSPMKGWREKTIFCTLYPHSVHRKEHASTRGYKVWVGIFCSSADELRAPSLQTLKRSRKCLGCQGWCRLLWISLFSPE